MGAGEHRAVRSEECTHYNPTTSDGLVLLAGSGLLWSLVWCDFVLQEVRVRTIVGQTSCLSIVKSTGYLQSVGVPSPASQ